ncbi:MAG: hypothetical protein C5B48_16345 [Candidatus Rokuibacteriota bacterium]|nr:MAG: hypothetical protein C5B48_16345 [Candidatus Rokubacteria bacterium]
MSYDTVRGALGFSGVDVSVSETSRVVRWADTIVGPGSLTVTFARAQNGHWIVARKSASDLGISPTVQQDRELARLASELRALGECGGTMRTAKFGELSTAYDDCLLKRGFPLPQDDVAGNR